MNTYHTSVFLKEAVDALDVQVGKKYIDATFGEGGHAREIVRRGGQLLAIDADIRQVQSNDTSATIIHGNFAEIGSIAKRAKFTKVSGILFDFGLSMRQIRESGKGFSFEKPLELLDMRLNNEGMSAANYLESMDFDTLKHDLMKYSEDIHSPEIAKQIIHMRSTKKIATVGDVLRLINTIVTGDMTTQKKCYARIFQALRIIVNNEIENIKSGLQQALDLTQSGGKIVVITFHSVEDRIVKSFARSKSEYLIESVVHVAKVRPLAKFERSAVLRVFSII